MKKKLTAMMLAAACMLNCTLTANAAETASGDVNGDGNITVSDAIMLARIVAEDITVSVTEEGKRNADLNASGAPDADDVTLLLRRLAGLDAPAEQEVHFECIEESEKSVETGMKLSLKTNAFAAKNETLTIEATMRDSVFTTHTGDDYRFEVYVCNPINYQNIEDEKLRVNGMCGGYQKNMNFDMPDNTELCHEEQVVLDFSDYQTGDSDCIKLTFLAEYFDHEVGRITSTRGNGHLLYFYVGENGIGISKESIEDAEKACQEQRSDEIIIHDAYTGKRNEKYITRGLFDALSSDSGEQIPVWMSFTITDDYTYKGKTLGEYSAAQYSEEIDKLDQLLNSGDVLKYSEAVYTTGTPDGTKWGKELYDARVEFFGEELLSKYIVDGEFLKDQLSDDLSALRTQSRAAYREAEEAYDQDAIKETADALKAQGIPCEARGDIKRVMMLVTAEQFDTLDFEKAACYGLARVQREVPEQTVQPVAPQPVSFEDLSAVVEALNGYNLDVYPEQYRETYREMYDRFNREKFVYQVQDNDVIINQADRSVALFPNVRYEDIGIGYYLTFQDQTYHITIYCANPDIAAGSNGIAEYLQKRTGRRTDKEITLQDRTISLTYPLDDSLQSEIYASAWIDESHYFTAKAITSEEEMTVFLNELHFTKFMINQPVTE